MHLRGNVEGWLGAGATQKWMEMHGREHWTDYYTDYGVALQREFFDHFLKGKTTAGTNRHRSACWSGTADDRYRATHGEEWPLAETNWTTMLSRRCIV